MRWPAVITAVLLSACGARTPEPTPAPPPAVVERGVHEEGLEVRFWVVRDPGGQSLSRVLGHYASRASPISAEAAFECMTGGWRVVPVPTADLEILKSSLPITGAVREEFLGQLSSWSTLATGESWDRPRPARGPTGDLTLPEGRIRTLARAWVAPALSADRVEPMLALEVVPQHVRQTTDPGSFLRERKPVEDQGLIFVRMAVRVSLRRGEALVIAPERPEAAWRGFEAASEGVADVTSKAGPETLRPPTIGELALSDATLTREAEMRVLIVLVPKLPERFSIIGR